MIEEQVDIVDKNDVVIQTVGISVAHKDVLLHRVASVLIFRPNKNLIMQKHKNYGRRFDHSVGGHVSAGEGYQEAAIREMEEELGLRIPITLVKEGVFSDERYPDANTNSKHMFGIFVGHVDQNWQLNETEEVDELVEMPIEKIVELMNAQPELFLQGFMTSLGAYLRSINSDLRITAYDREWGL